MDSDSDDHMVTSPRAPDTFDVQEPSNVQAYDANMSNAQLSSPAPLSDTPVENPSSIVTTDHRFSIASLCNPTNETTDLRPHYVSDLFGDNPIIQPSWVKESTSKIFISFCS